MTEFTTDIVIGLEIHVELDTESKLFCGCARKGSDEPNTRTCPVCLGHPGSKPVLNKKAVEHALKLCLALDCKINPELIFSRKSYFYPDMAKNYQISQFEIPLATEGKLKLKNGKEVRIHRIHMEEDPASLTHPAGMTQSSYVLVDYNRSGDPLAEIVTEPDMHGPEEARDFMKRLIEVINYLGIFDIDNCIIKADANVSVKESGYKRVEIKNITGFKEIERALFYEVERQRQEAAEGRDIANETRAWDPQAGITRLMRKKESEEDYGYIMDPDLTITDITGDMIEKIKAEIPELAQEKVEKYVEKYGLDQIDSEVLASDKGLAELFEGIIRSKTVDPVLTARWLRRELLRVLNYNKMQVKDLKIDAGQLRELLELIEGKKITDRVGQKILEELVITPFDIHDYIKRNKREAVSDSGELEKMCREAIEESERAVAEYKEGKDKALNSIVGKVMKKSKGTASPQEVKDIILKELNKE